MGSLELPPYTQTNFEYTESPNPSSSFEYGRKVSDTAHGKAWLEGEKAGWQTIDPENHDRMNLYQLMISAITPRPVAFVSSISETGSENLTLFSAGPNQLKDTQHNIKATKQFTVSIISEPWVENANVCSVDAPSDVNEWLLSGLTKEPSIHVKPSRVKESAFSMECELFQQTDIVHPTTGVMTTTLFLGLVKCIHVRKDMLNERGTVDPGKLMPVGRMGDILYGSLRGGYRIPRPAWKVEGEKIQEFLEKAGEHVPV